jgi:hypothetical protein
MSYKKMMKCTGAKYAKKRKNGMYMGFTTLAENERRKNPILGSCYYDFSLGFYETEEEMVKARMDYIEKYNKDTEMLLKTNPKLVLVD